MADKHLVLAFGRFQGITSGHEKVFKKLVDISKKFENAPIHVHMSHTHDNKKNPIPYVDKIALTKKMMPQYAKYIEDDKTIKTPFHMLSTYSDPETIIHIITGGDRVQEYQNLFNKYNGQEYTFKEIVVHNAGNRTDGVSGTAVRNFATANNFEAFKNCAPTSAKESDIKKVFDLIRKGLIVEGYKKTLNSLMSEAVDDKKTRRKKGNRVVINPDFSAYGMRTHDSKTIETTQDVKPGSAISSM